MHRNVTGTCMRFNQRGICVVVPTFWWCASLLVTALRRVKQNRSHQKPSTVWCGSRFMSLHRPRTCPFLLLNISVVVTIYPSSPVTRYFLRLWFTRIQLLNRLSHSDQKWPTRKTVEKKVDCSLSPSRSSYFLFLHPPCNVGGWCVRAFVFSLPLLAVIVVVVYVGLCLLPLPVSAVGYLLGCKWIAFI